MVHQTAPLYLVSRELNHGYDYL